LIIGDIKVLKLTQKTKKREISRKINSKWRLFVSLHRILNL